MTEPIGEVPYAKGLHAVGDGVWAYLQPDGGWGWSNAGLVADGSVSLLVDTLFDLKLTADMLATMRSAVPAAARIGTVVNTHANGDHCYGNALVSDAEIVASRAAAEEMEAVPPSLLDAFVKAGPDMGEAGAFVRQIFGGFTFEGIELVPPTRTFDGSLELRVGDKEVRLIEVGPAHTAGDVIVHVPGDGVLFTGDILFHGGHPVVWAGPVSNWIAACDRILALDDVGVVVPGHGPVGDLGAIAGLKGYFELLTAESRRCLDAGMPVREAVRSIDLGPYRGLGERERLAVNVAALYRDLGADVPTDTVTMFELMAELAADASAD
jgi:glyoxylase-like metal-dependent hydrolase (beta-lactamase superfamily II)